MTDPRKQVPKQRTLVPTLTPMSMMTEDFADGSERKWFRRAVPRARGKIHAWVGILTGLFGSLMWLTVISFVSKLVKTLLK